MLVVFSTLVGSASADGPLHPLGLPRQTAIGAPKSSAIIQLGRQIFFDPSFSADGTISCASCHLPEKAFSDGRVLARGIHDRETSRNAPSLLNVAFNTTQFWDGRRVTLEDQALDPFLNPLEHGIENEAALRSALVNNASYVKGISKAFRVKPERAGVKHMRIALAAYERTLLSGNSPFDRYFYGGDASALSPGARRGLDLFRGVARCESCHAIGKDGALFTDHDFHSLDIGLRRIAPRLDEVTSRLVRARKEGKSLDATVLDERDLAELGRFVVTLRPADIGKFKTPSLRNVAKTAPYMHDGSVSSLDEAVERELYGRGPDMGHPIVLTPLEKADLVAFLKSLNSEDLPSQ